MQSRIFRKCGEKSETSERNPIFGNKTAGRGSVKPGSDRPILIFPALPEPLARNMRQNQESPSTPPFRAEKPQVEALRHPGALGMFRICRILPVFVSVAGRFHSYHRLDNGQNSQFCLHTKRRQGRNCSCRRWRACLCCFRLAKRPVLDPYASVGSTPSSLRTSSKAAAMALSMS